MDNRIVITGAGMCCAVGTNVQEVLQSLRSGRSGLKPYHCSKAPNLNARYAGTIDHLPTKIDQRLLERWDRGTLLAAHAATEALTAAQIDLSKLPGDRLGLATGASGSGQFNPTDENPFEQAIIDPLTAKIVMQHNVPCFQTDELARHFGVHGPLITISSASAGSGIAIGMAMRWLQSGQADFVLAGGGEGLLPLNIIGFDLLGLLDSECCSPFSRSQGMSMGEGAGFVTLERYPSAVARGAPLLAQLHGFAVTSDAFDAIQFDPSGDGIRRAMDTAIRDSRLSPTDIDWIRASGAGGARQDASELAAIATTFGAHKPTVTSLESTMGHTNGAGPAMGLVSCLSCQQSEIMPGTLYFDTEHSSSDYDFVPNQPRAQKVDTFLSTTAAFGGTNVVLVGGRPRDFRHTPEVNGSIVISGMGLVTPLGCGQREIAARLLQESCQWSSVGSDAPQQNFSVGLVKDFEPRKLLSSLRLRGVDQLTRFAAAATKLALQDANLNSTSISEQVGIVSAISRPSGDSLGKLFSALQDSWASLAVSKALLRKGRFLVASQLANWFGCKGFTATVTDGLGASLGALIAASNQLQHSLDLKAVIVVAADEVSASGLRMWQALNCMSTSDIESWAPYEMSANGILAGEGAVALVLERAADAETRSQQPIAEVAGMAQTFDAIEVDHMGSVCEWLQADLSGKWLVQAIDRSLTRADCQASDVGMVIGNGCGVAAYDQRELSALRGVFGEALPLESVNRHVGVLESACGLLGIAAAASYVHQGSTSRVGVASRNRATLAEPPAVLVCTSSETGRNSAAIVKTAN